MRAKNFLLFLLILAPAVAAQKPDPDLLAKIRATRAIDNHSHPPKLVSAGETDTEFDALPCDPLEPTLPTLTSRPENPQFIAAWKALYGYQYDDMLPAHVREVLAAKQKVKDHEGDNYSNWVLDQLGIESELANRVAMGRGLNPPRFHWVPFEDTLLFPLNNEKLAAETPDRKIFYALESKLFQRYLKTLNKTQLPSTLADYLSQVVLPTLLDQKKNGAVAIKYEAAYLRPLNFKQAPREEAEQIYARYIQGGVPANADYYKLQNYIFYFIAREAGRFGLPVHIHTGYGCGGYFLLSGANPLLLESVLDDPDLRKTNFVLLHGGAGPYSKEVAQLLMKPNVYTDFSEQTWLLPTRELSKSIRYWLEWYPEKVMFGTDLYPGDATFGWEEVGWQTSQSGREALAIALTGMMNDNEISRARAEEIATMVLRGNALKLYGFTSQ